MKKINFKSFSSVCTSYANRFFCGYHYNLKMKDIQAAVHKLPEIFRNPFMLYFDGYKYNEIAAMLKEPLGTIKSRIHFARKLLKEQLTRF